MLKKIEEYRDKIEELKKEGIRDLAEEIKQRKKEILKKLKIEKLNPLLTEFKKTGSLQLYEQIKTIIKDAVGQYPSVLTEDELWSYCTEVAPEINYYRNLELGGEYT